MADGARIEELYELIEEMEIAILTTRRPDGRLVSRPMATQARSEGADLWFVTDIETHKVDELTAEPQVNVAYLNPRSMEWVSVSGRARLTDDAEKIRELYRPDWRAWFPEGGGAGEDGGPADPRLLLIAVDAESVAYMKNDKPRPVVLFEVVKGLITGEQPDVGRMEHIEGDLRTAD